jgi:hypothetical protein
MRNMPNKKFEKWYKEVFLEHEPTKLELIYLESFGPESKEGVAYVKAQKKLLEQAFIAGMKGRCE